jgi:hypothetical protein
VTTYVGRLILERVTWLDSGVTPWVDVFADFLLKRLSDSQPELFHCFEKLLGAYTRPPRDFAGFIDGIMGLIRRSEYQTEALLACLTASMSRAYTPIEEVYPTICGLLTEMISASQGCRPVCLACFGSLATIEPMGVSGDFESIISRVVNLTAQPQFNSSTLHITCFFRANRGFSQLESSFFDLWFAKSESKVSN